MRRISSSGTPRGSASLAFICRSSSRRARLAGDETNSTRKGLPMVVGPRFHLHPVALAIQQVVVLHQLVPAGELAVGSHLEAEELLGGGELLGLGESRRGGEGQTDDCEW